MVEFKTESSRKFKVVIIAPTPAPYRAYEYDLVQQALLDKYEFHVMFMERRWQEMQWQDDVPKLMRWEALPKSSLNWFLSKIPGFHRVNRDTIKHLKVLQPDAVILHGYDAPALWAAFLWAKIHNRPVLFRSDANIAKDQERSTISWRRLLKKCVVGAMFSRIDAFLTIGTANEAYYELYGGKRDRFFRSSYMVDVNKFATAATKEREQKRPLKAQLGIKEQKVILFVGRFVWKKDIETVLRAFVLALPDLGDTALVLAGDGPQRPKLEKAAQQAEGHVYLIGFRQPEELGGIYGMADALVLASVEEPWGLVVNEAMAAGLAVIASDKVGAACDLVVPGRTGEIFPAGEVEALAQCFKKVIKDSTTTEHMGYEGRQHLYAWNEKYNVTEGYRRALDYAIGNLKNK